MPALRSVWCASPLLILAIGASSVTAQPAPDGSLWNSVNNPSGQRAIPVVYFNQGSGILAVDTRGVDRISNTPTNTGLIGGDDVGMITLLVSGPAATSVFAPFNLPFDPGMGLAWSAMHFGAKMQLLGNPIIGQYVTPGVYPVFQYPAGSALVGHSVEIAINFGPGIPGNVLLGVVQNVPEPTLGGLLLVGLFTAMATRRCLSHSF